VADGVLSRKTLVDTFWRRGLWLTLATLSLVFVPPVIGQVREIAVESEVFRKTADGRRLADLGAGASVAIIRSQGSWVEVDLEGWVPSAAVGRTSREGHDAIITASGGEALLAQPSGRSVGHLLQGLLLDRVEERDGWLRVRRSGWVRDAALAPVSTPAAGSPGPDSGAERPPALVTQGRRLTAGEDSLELHSAPGAETMATVNPGTPITIVERGNRWTRVRVEGWVPSDQLVTADPDSVLVGVSAAALKANPDDYQGMRVRWTIQFIALEAAEAERIDFFEGEPFMLARPPDSGDGFVYVAVPPELLAAVRELEPLQKVDVLASIRTGRSTLMGVPVLDLLALF